MVIIYICIGFFLGIAFAKALLFFKKDGKISIDKRNPEKYIYRFDFNSDPMEFANRKIVILSVDTTAELSSREL